MPVNNFTVGKDVTVILNVNGQQLVLPGITDFTADPMTTELKSKPLNGIPQYGYIPDGYKLTVKLDRMGPALDAWWAAVEAGYFAGQNQVAGTVNENILEANGSISQWRYTGVVMKLEKSGDYSGDKKVEQTLTGMASLKILITL